MTLSINGNGAPASGLMPASATLQLQADVGAITPGGTATATLQMGSSYSATWTVTRTVSN